MIDDDVWFEVVDCLYNIGYYLFVILDIECFIWVFGVIEIIGLRKKLFFFVEVVGGKQFLCMDYVEKFLDFRFNQVLFVIIMGEGKVGCVGVFYIVQVVDYLCIFVIGVCCQIEGRIQEVEFL